MRFVEGLLPMTGLNRPKFIIVVETERQVLAGKATTTCQSAAALADANEYLVVEHQADQMPEKCFIMKLTF